MELIPKEEVVNALYDYWGNIPIVDDSGQGVWQDSIDTIEKLSTINIVRCHECKHLIVYNCGYACDAGHWIKISKEPNCGGMGDFYCAEGERNERNI